VPHRNVDDPRTAQQHLDAAREYIAVAESEDAKRTAYEHAADEVLAAMAADPTLGPKAIGKQIGKSHEWVRKLLRWRTSANPSWSPFTRDAREHAGDASPDDSTARKVARERPAVFAKAYEDAPVEARREIARQIAADPEIRVEARKQDAAAEAARRPSPVPPRGDLTLYQFEARLSTAYGALKQALELLGEVNQPGDDDDVLAAIHRIRQMADVIEEAYRTGKSLDTWAAELYEGRAER
jgi:hypothetical protein